MSMWRVGVLLLAVAVCAPVLTTTRAEAQETEVIPISRPIQTLRFGPRDTLPHGHISAGVGTIIAGVTASSVGGLFALMVLTFGGRWAPTWIEPLGAAAVSCFVPIAGPIAYGIAALEQNVLGVALFSFANALAQSIGVVLLIIGGVDQHETRLSLQPHFTESSVGLTGFGTF